jgi:hypothetical protein
MFNFFKKFKFWNAKNVQIFLKSSDFKKVQIYKCSICSKSLFFENVHM